MNQLKKALLSKDLVHIFKVHEFMNSCPIVLVFFMNQLKKALLSKDLVHILVHLFGAYIQGVS